MAVVTFFLLMYRTATFIIMFDFNVFPDEMIICLKKSSGWRHSHWLVMEWVLETMGKMELILLFCLLDNARIPIFKQVNKTILCRDNRLLYLSTHTLEIYPL